MKLKRYTLTFLLMGYLTTCLNAQIIQKGEKIVNLGLGVGGGLYTGSYYKTSTPPVSASFEIGIKDNVVEKGSIGIGGYLGYASYKYEVNNWGWKYTNFILGARGSFHYPLLEKLDTYTGLTLAYNVVSAKEFGTSLLGVNLSAKSSGVLVAWHLGGRYYLNDKLALMTELGYGITYLNLGIAFKL